MGSVLVSKISNFYLTDLENRIFKIPSIYLKNLDDILILSDDTNEINILRDTFQKFQFLMN